jgi:short-subunit dehydrogenase
VKAHRVTGLVNNAGISIAKRAENLSLEDIDTVMGVNFRALVQCVQAVLPGMRQAQYGRIVNIGSRAALRT